MAERDLRPLGGLGVRPAASFDAAGRAADGRASLLLCAAGPHRLVFDLRSLRHVEAVEEDVPLLPGAQDVHPADEVDLRRLLGVVAGPPQALLYALEGDPRLRRVTVDAGSLRLRSVPLGAVQPLPAVLARAAALQALRGVVELDGGPLAWLVDPTRLPAPGGPA
ncbi:MAG: hypothetical protein M9894_22920 [Planctomycetes bacterium]|nr:hypothetical protein [Planctomycetota bacterium]